MSGRAVDTLADLVDEVRNRMAANPTTSFYYSEADVRLFLAGLAASRLHLLQGISGTGKTSLPREFFKALAGDTAVQIVEVQAGWRDKDDLFGYYNAFEKRFAESEFTKALYRALLPANADRPMVIVLDEMNLAHPEQYFSVMFSLLENSTTDRGHLDLLTSEIPNLPQLVRGFAPSSAEERVVRRYRQPRRDDGRVRRQDLRPRSRPSTPVHLRAVRASNPGRQWARLVCGTRRRVHHRSAQLAGKRRKVKDFLRTRLREEFEKFGVGWGNRLERQIDPFVPVVLDSGGDLTEAVDHLVATKLVRKLEDRFGVRPEDLDVLAGNIEVHWEELQPSSLPKQDAGGSS